MEGFDGVLVYELHPPDDLWLFRVPAAGVLRADADALVIEVRAGDIVLRHYDVSRALVRG